MKRFLPLGLFLLITLVCLGGWMLSEGERYKDPPFMRLHCGDQAVSIEGSAISWTYDKWLGKESYEAQLIHPTERSDWPTDLEIWRAEETSLHFLREDGPVEKLGTVIELRCWPEEDFGDGGAEGAEIEITADPWEQYAFTPVPGRNLYAVIVKYFDTEHYSGTVRYTFVIDYQVR